MIWAFACTIEWLICNAQACEQLSELTDGFSLIDIQSEKMKRVLCSFRQLVRDNLELTSLSRHSLH